MQRKILNTKKVRSWAYAQNGQEKLHSIPIIKMKSSVLYSISCTATLLLIGSIGLAFSNSCHAVASVSLSIITPEMSTSATQGSSAAVSTKINVNVSEVSNYSLMLKVKDDNLVNGDTTIVPGDVVADNTWGYKWDKDADSNTYKSPSSTGTTLTVPALSNNAADFEGTLTFGAKFSTNASIGSYKNEGNVILTATPNVVTAKWSNGTDSGISTMQEMTSTICNQVSTPTANTTAGATDAPTLLLRDTRDNNEYVIAKYPDGKCWMTQNLRLKLTDLGLKASNTDITTDWTSSSSIKPTNTYTSLQKAYFSEATSGYYKAESYIANPRSEEHDTGYYSWSAATAGTGTSSITTGVAPGSICPKGWRLPSGGSLSGTANENQGEYQQLFNKIGAIYGNFDDDYDRAKLINGSPYFFTYTGYVQNGNLTYNIMASWSNWWSRTIKDSKLAYALDSSIIDAVYLSPAGSNERYRGQSIRCIAR